MTSEDTLINASAFIISCWIKLSTVINVIIQQQGASTVYVSAQEVRDVSKEEEREKLDVTFSCMTNVEELNFKSFYHSQFFQ